MDEKKKNCNKEAKNIRQLSVEQWHMISKELLKEGQLLPVSFKVNGYSMWPLIRYQKDIVTVIPIDQELKPGDIVLFPGKRMGGNYVLHRIDQIREEKVLTWGDGCLHPDQWLQKKDILGIVIKIQRGSREIDPDSVKMQKFWEVWKKCLPVRKHILNMYWYARWIKDRGRTLRWNKKKTRKV